MEYNNELYHYGVMGMKWGVRRYRDANGNLTAAGKKRAKQEYKADNKMAKELGKNATVYGHATAKSMKRTIKLENKLDKQYDKDPSGSKRKTQSLKKKWDASSKATSELAETYLRNRDAAEKHCDSLIKKYGKEAVSNIKYTDKKLPKGEYSPKTFRTMNESTNSISDYAKAGAMSLTTVAAATLLGSPFAPIFAPTTTGEKAAGLEYDTYRKNLKG